MREHLLIFTRRRAWRHKPATSNSISSVTLLVSAASRSSWLASSSVPSSVGIPLIDSRRSPTCSRPHLRQRLPRWCQKRSETLDIFTLLIGQPTIFVREGGAEENVMIGSDWEAGCHEPAHNLISHLFYSKWDHNLKNKHRAVLKEDLKLVTEIQKSFWNCLRR